MKRLVGTVVILVLSAVVAACGGTSGTPDGDAVGHPDATDLPSDDPGAEPGAADAEPQDRVGPDDSPDDVPATDVPPGDPGEDDAPNADLGPADPGGDDGVLEDDTPTADLPVDGGQDPGTDPGATCVVDPVGGCKAAYQCMNDCPAGVAGETCIQECLGRLSTEGGRQYAAFSGCMMTNCSSASDQEACLVEKCMDPYFGCIWGCQFADCASLAACINACPADTTGAACVVGCWEGAQTTAAIDLQDAYDCNRGACPVCLVADPTPAQAAECETCWNAAFAGTCGPYWEKCIPYGTMTCGDTLDCANNCPDAACVQDCFAGATKTALDLWDSVIQCGRAACVASCPAEPTPAQQTACDSCVNTALGPGGSCYTTLQACLNDKAAR